MRLKNVLQIAAIGLVFGAFVSRSYAEDNKREPAQATVSPSCSDSIAKQIKAAHTDDQALRTCYGVTVKYTHTQAGEADFQCGCNPRGPGPHCFAILAIQYTFEVDGNCRVTESKRVTYDEPAGGGDQTSRPPPATFR